MRVSASGRGVARQASSPAGLAACDDSLLNAGEVAQPLSTCATPLHSGSVRLAQGRVPGQMTMPPLLQTTQWHGRLHVQASMPVRSLPVSQTDLWLADQL